MGYLVVQEAPNKHKERRWEMQLRGQAGERQKKKRGLKDQVPIGRQLQRSPKKLSRRRTTAKPSSPAPGAASPKRG